jgi:hypothetical protein
MQRLVELTAQRTGGGAPLDPGLMEMHGQGFGAAQEAMPALSETVGARGSALPPPPAPAGVGIEFQGGDIETGSYGYATMDTPRAAPAPTSGGGDGILSKLGLHISQNTVYIIVVVVAALLAGLTYILCQTGKLSNIVGKYMGKMTGKDSDGGDKKTPPSNKTVSFDLPSGDQNGAAAPSGADKKKKKKAKKKKNKNASAAPTVTGGAAPSEFPMARPPRAEQPSDDETGGVPLRDDPLWTPL